MSLIQIRIICRYAITIFIAVTRKKANNKNEGLLHILSIVTKLTNLESVAFLTSVYLRACFYHKPEINFRDPLELLSITNNTTNVGYIVFHT